MRALQRLAVPTLIFVNKIDRRGADAERTLAAIEERLTAVVRCRRSSHMGRAVGAVVGTRLAALLV